MKTLDERSAFRQEVETRMKQLTELSGEELSQVAGGTLEALHEAEDKVYNVFYDYKLNGYSKSGFTRAATDAAATVANLDNDDWKSLNQLINLLYYQL